MIPILWAGSQESFYQLEGLIKQMSEASSEVLKQASDWEDEQDELDTEHHLLQIIDGIAFVRIKGMLIEGSAGWWGSWCNIVGYDDIRNAIVCAINAGAKEIVCYISSPGGMVMGIGACSDFIREANKSVPIQFYTDTLCASGGVWLGATLGNLVASRHAEVGSVGVVGVTSEYTEYFKMIGVTKRVFKSTPLKMSGNPNEKLDAANAAEIQRSVDDSAKRFIDHLAQGLKLSSDYISSNIATGQMWYADEAMQLGLVSKIMSFDELLVDLQKKVQQNTQNAGPTYSYLPEASSTNSDKEATGSMKKKVIKPKTQEELLAAAASGVLVAQASDESEESEEDAGTTSAETETEESADDTTEASTASTDKKVEDGSLSSAFTQTTDKLISTMTELATARAELAVSNSKLSVALAVEVQLKEIVVKAVQKAHVGAGAAEPNAATLMEMSSEALLVQYANAEEMLAKRFGSGGRISAQIDEAESEDTKKAEAYAQHFEVSALNAARIGK